MSNSTENIALEVVDIQKTFATAQGKSVAVDKFSMQVLKGEFVSIIGHSGCGKSTVLYMIAGLLPIEKGSILLHGKPIIGAGLDRGIVFQSPNLLPWLSVYENVRLGVDQVSKGASKKQVEEICIHYLTLVGLENDFSKKISELSQGMKQRVGIARAYAIRPSLLLLDEPFGPMDSLTRSDLQDTLLKIWNVEKTTTILVTHDVDEALYLSDRVIMMTKGPAAKVGGTLSVNIERPRDRTALLENKEYQNLNENVLNFLENQ